MFMLLVAHSDNHIDAPFHLLRMHVHTHNTLHLAYTHTHIHTHTHTQNISDVVTRSRNRAVLLLYLRFFNILMSRKKYGADDSKASGNQFYIDCVDS